MHEPPKKSRKGVKKHVRDINELRDFVLKTRIIPDNGFEETSSGVMPPPRSREYVPMWSPGFSRTDRSEPAGKTYFYFRRGGFVLVPYHAGETVTQIPHHTAVPLIPTMQDAYSGGTVKIVVSPSGRDGGTKPPVMIAPRKSVGFDGKTVAVLEVVFGGRAENIGARQFADGSYSAGVRIDTGLIGGDTASASAGEAHVHDGSTLTVDQNKVAVPLSEYNYAATTLTAASVVLESVDDFETNPRDDSDAETGAVTTRLPLGWFQIDEQGYLIDSQWYAEGTLTVSLPTGLLKSESSDPERTPDNITFPTDSSDYTLPIGAD